MAMLLLLLLVVVLRGFVLITTDEICPSAGLRRFTGCLRSGVLWLRVRGGLLSRLQFILGWSRMRGLLAVRRVIVQLRLL